MDTNIANYVSESAVRVTTCHHRNRLQSLAVQIYSAGKPALVLAFTASHSLVK